MSVDLGFDDAQHAIAEALSQFCAERYTEESQHGEADFPRELWRELGELGVLALGTAEGEGGACEAVAALEALGAALFPGPLAASLLAAQALPEALRARVCSGEALVSLGEPPLLPFAAQADLHLAVVGGKLLRVEPSSIEPVATLGGEPWGRVEFGGGQALDAAPRAWALHDLALAAYGAAAGLALVEATAEHAKSRVQFGKPIGEFQAVAHPLADARIRLDAAAALARVAAHAWDTDAPDLRERAAAARLSAARAGVEAAHTGHQLFGALGITVEGPVFRFSRRLRQLASGAPAEAEARAALLAQRGLS